ncbi:ATP-binding protein [Croceiramulus getboli]|nr:ATP-binding protein [Flavobacteriaceae bacterium YJPT1-3]
MLDTIREEFIEDRFQVLETNFQGEVLQSDHRLVYLKKGLQLQEFHPFFFCLESIFEGDQEEVAFHCVHIELAGLERFLDIVVRPQFEEQTAVILLHDLSDHYKAAQEIKQGRNESIIDFKEAEERNRVLEVQRAFRNKFVADISHEIRTPLNSIVGFLSLLERTGLDREQIDLVNISRKAAHHLVSIVDDLLDISKIEAGKMNLENSRFDFVAMVNDVAKTYRLKCDEKRLNFHFEIDRDFPRFIVSDEKRLRQIMTNLLENAVKFTQKGQVLFRIHHKSRKTRHLPVTIEVSDTGAGIAQDAQEKIFDSFVQLDQKGFFGGSGLGLNIVKQLVDLLEGSLTLESAPSEGSTFTVNLKLAASLNQTKQKTTKKTTPMPKNGKRLRVLLAEDVEVNQFLIQKIFLDSKQFSLDLATNGERAVQLAEKFDYDLILMDLTMPVLDGIDATRILRDHKESRLRKIPIVALSGRVTEDDLEEAREAGMDDFIAKPVDPDELIPNLLQILSRRKKK